MRRVIKCLDMALLIRKGEIIRHPVFGRIKVDGIYEIKEKDYEAFCILLDFNNTHRVFNLLDLSKVKFKQKGLRVVK